jgi:hypothetical protein
MRALTLTCLLCACGNAAYLSGPVDTQEYIFVLNNGGSFMRVLPTDWEPVYEGGFLRIDARHRVMAMDVILIQPRYPIAPDSLEMARVFRNHSSRSAASYDLWVPPGQELHVGAPYRSELIKVAPQTWIRPNEFRIELRRPLDRR